MAVATCSHCDRDPESQRLYGSAGLDEGVVCPVCSRPTCRFHLATVRWRWRDSGEAAEAKVCVTCRRSYAHRHWDAYRRDWIT